MNRFADVDVRSSFVSACHLTAQPRFVRLTSTPRAASVKKVPLQTELSRRQRRGGGGDWRGAGVEVNSLDHEVVKLFLRELIAPPPTPRKLLFSIPSTLKQSVRLALSGNGRSSVPTPEAISECRGHRLPEMVRARLRCRRRSGHFVVAVRHNELFFRQSRPEAYLQVGSMDAALTALANRFSHLQQRLLNKSN